MNFREDDTNRVPVAGAVASHPREAAVHRTNCYLFDLEEEGDASFPYDSAAACTEAAAGSSSGFLDDSSCTVAAARKAAASALDP